MAPSAGNSLHVPASDLETVLVEVARGGDRQLLREVESLTEALSTRTIIANAVGLLMASGAVTRDEAFDQLR
ncbi:MAG TPA: ANTAR domain-containing protein, partial [Acidimicrobiales bacterium]